MPWHPRNGPTGLLPCGATGTRARERIPGRTSTGRTLPTRKKPSSPPAAPTTPATSDLSSEMVAKAESYQLPRLTFRAVSGGDLAGIAGDSVDFVLSFAVFQHVPDKSAILKYFEETARVLRPGGFFRLHLKGLWTLALGRWLIEAGISEKRGRAIKLPFVRLRYLDTWQGRSVPLPEVRETCRRCGLEILDVESPWTNMMWVGGRKR